jgi:hypothetical protein
MAESVTDIPYENQLFCETNGGAVRRTRRDAATWACLAPQQSGSVGSIRGDGQRFQSPRLINPLM